MRPIGEIADEQQAKLFGDYLYVRGIENEVDEDGGEWTIWVYDDDQLSTASAELEAFLANPDARKYRKAHARAGGMREREAEEDQRARKRQVDVRTEIFGRQFVAAPHLTYGLMGLCVVVFILLETEMGKGLRQALSITAIIREGPMIKWNPGVPEVLNGEVWRLFSPAFLHFGILHILFNMMWLHRLGGEFERRLGTGWFALFLLVAAVVSNVAQFWVNLPPVFEYGPQFGGMSGVVYGLAGHAWMRGRRDPRAGIELDESTFMFLMIWFFLCFLPFMPIANTAHAAGLLVGLAWGWVASMRAR